MILKFWYMENVYIFCNLESELIFVKFLFRLDFWCVLKFKVVSGGSQTLGSCLLVQIALQWRGCMHFLMSCFTSSHGEVRSVECWGRLAVWEGRLWDVWSVRRWSAGRWAVRWWAVWRGGLCEEVGCHSQWFSTRSCWLGFVIGLSFPGCPFFTSHLLTWTLDRMILPEVALRNYVRRSGSIQGNNSYCLEIP